MVPPGARAACWPGGAACRRFTPPTLIRPCCVVLDPRGWMLHLREQSNLGDCSLVTDQGVQVVAELKHAGDGPGTMGGG